MKLAERVLSLLETKTKAKDIRLTNSNRTMSATIIMKFNKNFENIPLQYDLVVGKGMQLKKGMTVSSDDGDAIIYDNDKFIGRISNGYDLSKILAAMQSKKAPKEITMNQIKRKIKPLFPKGSMYIKKGPKDREELYVIYDINNIDRGAIISIQDDKVSLNFATGIFPKQGSYHSNMWDHSYHESFTLVDVVNFLKRYVEQT